MTAPKKPTKTVAKKRIGRPRTVTAAVQERILEALFAGNTLSEACAMAGTAYRTVLRAEAEDGAFGTLLARARLASAAHRLEKAELAIASAKTHEDIGRARELAIHGRWIASKILPAFADRASQTAVQVNVSTAPGPSDPRSSWTTKLIGEWSPQERIEASKSIAFEVALLGQRLQTMGFPGQLDVAVRSLGQGILDAVQGRTSPPPAPPLALPYREIIDITAEADGPASPLGGVPAGMRADITAMSEAAKPRHLSAAERRLAEEREALEAAEIAQFGRVLTARERDELAEDVERIHQRADRARDDIARPRPARPPYRKPPPY